MQHSALPPRLRTEWLRNGVDVFPLGRLLGRCDPQVMRSYLAQITSDIPAATFAAVPWTMSCEVCQPPPTGNEHPAASTLTALPPAVGMGAH